MRLIDADTLKPSYIVTSTTTNSLCHLYVSLEDINSAPTIEAEPVRRARWLHTEDDIIISGQCSECGWVSAVGETDVAGMPYCPNCGAKMEEE